MTESEKLIAIINNIDSLIKKNVTKNSPEFGAWFTKAERFLAKHYGNESIEYTSFKNIKFHPSIYTSGTDLVGRCRKGLEEAKITFSDYLSEITDEVETKIETQRYLDKIFIVHGHNGELKESVARVIEKQNIEAIILSEQANAGNTIIRKIEENSNVGGAICLFTADDKGNEKTESEMKDRARQNVVFEAGFFIGKLGRDRVVIIADESVDLPSDLSGMVYTNANNWQHGLLVELKKMGYNVDANKLL